MLFHQTVDLNDEEKAILQKAKEIINDVCVFIDDCDDCPMCDMCEMVKTNKYNLSALFADTVAALCD